MGALAPQALQAYEQIAATIPGTGLLAVTSADRLHRGWLAAQREQRAGRSDITSTVEALLSPLAPDARIVTLSDAHPAVLSWLGSVLGQSVRALGVETFGQSGTLSELYETYRLDEDSLLAACTNPA